MAATLQRKTSGGIIFVIITKTLTKENVPRMFFRNKFGQDGKKKKKKNKINKKRKKQREKLGEGQPDQR